jgi:hypothetical protein
MEEGELMIFIGIGEGDSDALRVTLKGTPNQALGFIARARFELDKMERGIHAQLTKEPAHV